MAKHYVTTWLDDLDGSAAAETFEFSFAGVSYVIDLSEANAARLRLSLEPYLQAASKVSRRPARHSSSRVPPPSAQPQTHQQKARDWLRLNGYHVGGRGCLPKQLLLAYESAQLAGMGRRFGEAGA